MMHSVEQLRISWFLHAERWFWPGSLTVRVFGAKHPLSHLLKRPVLPDVSREA